MNLLAPVSLAARLYELDVPAELVREAERLEALAEDYRHLCHARGALNLTDAAKVLEVSPKRLINWLIGHDWVFREPKDRLAAYEAKLRAGLLKQKMFRGYQVDGSEIAGFQVLVTAKGMAALAAEFRRERAEDERKGPYADPTGE